MDDVNYHLSLFPPRLRKILEDFSGWDGICEIRLRSNAPLSLTDYSGNITLNESGVPCPVTEGICCEPNELSHLLGAFCGGSVYRYFNHLKDGFAVDDFGWRLGICAEQTESGTFLPQQVTGINLRIPRQTPLAAIPVIEKMEKEGLFSLLIFSDPGAGKTTLLRSLASLISIGSEGFAPLRVAVVDEKGELFPPKMNVQSGLLDVLCSYKKGEGIGFATTLFSPQVIVCDEICNENEAEALINSCSGGCHVFATAHAGSRAEANRIPYLAKLMDSGKFRYGLFLQKEPSSEYRCRMIWERLS